MHRPLSVLLLLACTTGQVWGDATRSSIGVLVGEGEFDVLERWTPTADYLTRQIAGYSFVIVPLSREAMGRAVARDELDFVVTDPGHYVDLASNHGTSCLATIQHSRRGASYSVFGAVILARAGREDLAWMSDARGKSFMAVEATSFDGFQIAWWELKSHNIDPFHDLSRLVFSGAPPERIVGAVRDGRVDAGVVRTSVLERMIAEGTIDLTELRVLHPVMTPEFPFAISTELYPEWPFAKARGTPDALADRVAGALKAMPANEPAARAGGYAGWTIPADYQPVHELLKDLQLAPYNGAAEITFADAVRANWQWAAFIFALLLLMGTTIAFMWGFSYRLSASKRSLERARQLEAQIAHVGRVASMGEMSTTLAHELNQPLAAIVNYANGSIRRLRADEVSKDELLTVLGRIAFESNRSAEIVRRIRDFLRKRKPLLAQVDVNRIVRDAVDLANLRAQRNNVSVRPELSHDLPSVMADAIQIEQVIVNLVHNAIEAIDDAGSPRREVIVRTQRNASQGVDVIVRDTGPGLPGGDPERLFDAFVSTKSEGMGMGLSISRSIIEAHGERLRAMPSPDGGAMFLFTLPAAKGGRVP